MSQVDQSFAELAVRYPVLEALLPVLRACRERLASCFKNGNTFYIAGNGGSASDAEHICGELLKGFKSRRPLEEAEVKRYMELFGENGAELARQLQGGLRSVSLLSHPALASAFANDVNPELGFAQQLNALGREGDVFLAISTGGNARNLYYAMMTAKAKNITTILLTGNGHGRCEALADHVIAVPEKETYRIQELHLPVYHALCSELEALMFE